MLGGDVRTSWSHACRFPQQEETLVTAASRQFDTADISSIQFWSQPPSVWDDTFRTLRDARPVSWHKAPEGSLLPTPPDDGFWAVVRHADIVAVSSQPDLYISSKGVQFEELPDDILQATQSIVALDAPRHLKLRSLVSSAFSPARMEQMRASMAEEVRRIVEDFATAGECDFVAKVSMPMARWTMTYMLGLEAAEIDRFTEAISIMLSSRDEAQKLGKDRAELVNEVVGLVSGTAVEMAKARRADPQDDVMTDLVQARVDGEGLTDAEISAFFLLLIGAGFDTPRQTISHAGKALSDFPAQRALLAADFDTLSGKAVEELLRWATPVLTLRRTASRDTELNGQKIRRVTRSPCSTRRATATSASSPTPTPSTSPAPPTGTSASAAAAPTTASATSWPAWSSACSSANSCAAYRTSRSVSRSG